MSQENFRMCSDCSAVIEAFTERIRPSAPAATGDAMLVPLQAS